MNARLYELIITETAARLLIKKNFKETSYTIAERRVSHEKQRKRLNTKKNWNHNWNSRRDFSRGRLTTQSFDSGLLRCRLAMSENNTKKKNRKRTRSVKLCDKRQRIERENTMPPCDTNKRKVNISKRMRNAFEKHWFQRAHYLSFRFSAWDTPREFECWYERKSVSSGFLKNEIFFFVRDDRMRRVKSGSHARGNLLPLNSTVNSTVK